MIVITGASDGLGHALANLYRLEGKTVINLSRSESDQADINILTDLRDEKSIDRAVKQIEAIKEPLEVLVNCAGVLSVEEIEKTTSQELDRVLDTNIRGPMLLTTKLMKRIKKDGTDIANVASTVGTKGYEGQAAYGVSKWAIRGFSANLQVELKDTPCRVISYCPGGFLTKLFKKAARSPETPVRASDWMRAEDVAQFLKQTLDLPKNMEVSEVIVNRKITK
jgi:NADP-dependent 3-hydroxy acid dehydrogenase YdfG